MSESISRYDKIKKVVYPVTDFVRAFLPATKAMPKELLPILCKPQIQYAAEEAIAAGIDKLFFITECNKLTIEVHFDANNELETMLRTKGKMRRIFNKAVEMLKATNITQADIFPKDYCPLGLFESLSLGDRFQVKLI